MKSQNQAILEALQAGEKLTTLDMFNRFACLNGNGRIADLRVDGWTQIVTEMIEVENRFGQKVKVGLYSIPPGMREKPLGRVLPQSQPVPLRRNEAGQFAREQSLNKDILEKSRAMYLSGKPIREIGKELNIPWTTLYKYLRDMGVEFRHPGQQGKLFTETSYGEV